MLLDSFGFYTGLRATARFFLQSAWSGEARRVVQRTAARAHEFDALTSRSVANERDTQGAGFDELAAAAQTHLAVERFWFTDLAVIHLAPQLDPARFQRTSEF